MANEECCRSFGVCETCGKEIRTVVYHPKDEPIIPVEEEPSWEEIAAEEIRAEVANCAAGKHCWCWNRQDKGHKRCCDCGAIG